VPIRVDLWLLALVDEEMALNPYTCSRTCEMPSPNDGMEQSRGGQQRMDVMEAIHTRRSIRKFQQKLVPDELVKELLSAAMSAPSAGNQQPWHFVVITDQEILGRVPGLNPYAAMAREAPLAILVCAELALEKYPGYWVQDCSAATQNLLLAAHGKGLGAVWTGITPMPDRVEGFKKLCNLPEKVIPLALVVVGYPAQTLKPEDRFRADRVHRNTW
jgi:nitroreductase